MDDAMYEKVCSDRFTRLENKIDDVHRLIMEGIARKEDVTTQKSQFNVSTIVALCAVAAAIIIPLVR